MEYEVMDRVMDGVEFTVRSSVDVATGRLFWGGRAILDVAYDGRWNGWVW